MKKYEVEESFIRDAHKAACAEWKSKLESKFPDVFKQEFKVGDWVKNHLGEIVRVTKIEDGCIRFDVHGINNFGQTFNNSARLATESEILSHLIKEAEKRGFKDGVEINKSELSNCKTNVTIRNSNFEYILSADALLLDGHYIYKQGKWATIIEQPEDKFTELIRKYDVQIKELRFQIAELDAQSQRIKEVLNGSR